VTIEAQVQQVMQSMGSGVLDPILTSMSPLVKGRSNCGSTPLNEEEANEPYPVNDITEPIHAKLYICSQWTTNKVVVG